MRKLRKVSGNLIRWIRYWEKSGTWYFFSESTCLHIAMFAGWWASLGIHISLVPLYIDLHLVWFIVTLMPRARGVENYAAEITTREDYFLGTRAIFQRGM